jgi:hypothetical protein
MRIEAPVPLQGHLLPFNCLLREFLTLPNGLLVCLVVVVLAVRYAKSPWRRVPPGPRGLPLLGNAPELWDKTWLFGRDCKNAYRVFSFILGSGNTVAYQASTLGDMIYLNTLGQPILVVNSLKVAAELLDRRANIYSDRPRMIVANEILSGGLFFGLMPYGDL